MWDSSSWPLQKGLWARRTQPGRYAASDSALARSLKPRPCLAPGHVCGCWAGWLYSFLCSGLVAFRRSTAVSGPGALSSGAGTWRSPTLLGGSMAPWPRPWWRLRVFSGSSPGGYWSIVDLNVALVSGDLVIHKHISRRRQWHPTPVPLPGNSHGQRSLGGCHPWGH